MNNYFVVIMAGGAGTRFWPYSREKLPKQFLDILGIGKSLLRMTFERFTNICPPENIFVVTSENYTQIVKDQIPEISHQQILSEPFRRNTATCIAYASFKIRKQNPHATIVVSPSDHAIFKEDVFQQCINTGLKEASNTGKLMTLGIKPTRPDTGYGYIQYEKEEKLFKKVKKFTEKPDVQHAIQFIEGGDYVWNAGIFIWHVDTIIQALSDYLPDIAAAFESGIDKYFTPEETSFIHEIYPGCQNISVDYGIMEKSKNVFVILGEFSWSDLGSWATLHAMREKNEDMNVIDGNALIYDCEDCVIKGPEDRLIVVQGLKNYWIATCDNVILICDKNNEKQFRTFVQDVKDLKGDQFL